ncbi:MAG: hypothetical protein FJW20_04625 [Acidimicrobiia bacterium]|nr:hypothetical protein [Acidimicrobiia bacterium]
MPVSAPATPLEQLAAARNADGGWGYFPGRSSWLEPTYYAKLALHPDGISTQSWNLIRSWQLPEGGCRPNNTVKEPNWTTALFVTLHCLRQQSGPPFHAGLNWLLEARGAESSLLRRAANRLWSIEKNYRPNLYGWNWFPGTHSWIEPTVHAMVALQLALRLNPGLDASLQDRLRARLALAQEMLLARRCNDGGWNYGAPYSLEVELPSYPETTALALIGLQQARLREFDRSLDKATAWLESRPSPLAEAWLHLALRIHGRPVPPLRAISTRDNLLLALRELAAGPNFRLLKVGSA